MAPTTCSEMTDPTHCIEAALLADVPGYDPTADIVDTVVAVMDTDTFIERYPYPHSPRIEVRALPENTSLLAAIEDREGHRRGAIAGMAVPNPEEGTVDIYLTDGVAPIIGVHELAHACIEYHPEDDHRTDLVPHDHRWREAFRALLEATYDGAGLAYDGAVSGTAECDHGSVHDPATHEVFADAI